MLKGTGVVVEEVRLVENLPGEININVVEDQHLPQIGKQAFARARSRKRKGW